jgi:hypothetical protein
MNDDIIIIDYYRNRLNIKQYTRGNLPDDILYVFIFLLTEKVSFFVVSFIKIIIMIIIDENCLISSIDKINKICHLI